jgi:hypothetical protein
LSPSIFGVRFEEFVVVIYPEPKNEDFGYFYTGSNYRESFF